MLFRTFEEKDRQEFCDMAHEFHFSEAVIHKTPTEYFIKTFENILAGNPYVEGYILEKDGQTAGYGLCFTTYSNEADGLLTTWDEIYIKPEFRGQGLGTRYIAFLEEAHRDTVSLFRMEVEEANAGARDLYLSLGYKQLEYRQLCKYCSDTTPEAGPFPMVRPLRMDDEAVFIEMATEYYNTMGLTRPAEPERFRRTLARAAGDSPFLDGYLILKDGRPAGYALVCLTFSNEARGELTNLDELYIRPEYRGQGLCRAFMAFWEKQYHDGAIYRIELRGTDERHMKLLVDGGYELLDYFQMIKPAHPDN